MRAREPSGVTVSRPRRQPERGCAPKPRVGVLDNPGYPVPIIRQPQRGCGLVLLELARVTRPPRRSRRHNPVGVDDSIRLLPRVAGRRATLGFGTQSLWDCQAAAHTGTVTTQSCAQRARRRRKRLVVPDRSWFHRWPMFKHASFVTAGLLVLFLGCGRVVSAQTNWPPRPGAGARVI